MSTIPSRPRPALFGNHARHLKPAFKHSTSSLVNASTWALMLTGRVRGAVKWLGKPVIRTAVSRAMKEMGRQFVLGQDIDVTMDRAAGMEAKGFTYSYDLPQDQQPHTQHKKQGAGRDDVRLAHSGPAQHPPRPVNENGKPEDQIIHAP